MVLPILAGLFPTSTGEGVLPRARTKPVPCLPTFSGGTVVQEECGRADVRTCGRGYRPASWSECGQNRRAGRVTRSVGKLAGDHPGGRGAGVPLMRALAEDPLRRSPTMNQVALVASPPSPAPWCLRGGDTRRVITAGRGCAWAPQNGPWPTLDLAAVCVTCQGPWNEIARTGH